MNAWPRTMPAQPCPDFAVFQLENGRYVVGSGELSYQSEPPETGIGFYINDFGLSNTSPWVVFDQSLTTNDLNSYFTQPKEELQLSWDGLKEAPFYEIFEELKSLLLEKQIEKVVPAVTLKGRLDRGSFIDLIFRFLQFEARPPIRRYGFSTNQTGMAGVTPETLMAVNGKCLRTVALAGTCSTENEASFSQDAK
ncbi:MAG: chorismate-binding protein, partial [Verrucomicrobiota bacterium]